MLMQTSNSLASLRLIWSSPVFGDAFPQALSGPATVLSKMESLYPLFVKSLGTVLAGGLPVLSPEAIDKVVQHITSRIIPYSSAISAGEIADMERLRAATMIISLVYWADHQMDEGDEGMLAAMCLFNRDLEMEQSAKPQVPAATVQARLAVLHWIEQEVKNLCLPEDGPTLLTYGVQETLYHDYKKRDLSREYSVLKTKDFWSAHAAELVESLFVTAATILATSAMYSAYRYVQPELPSLPQAFKETAVMEVLRGPYNAAIRIFDDLSDRLQDRRHDPGWREFNLNVFNQPEPGFIRVFSSQAGLRDERVIEAVLEAFQSGTEDGRAYIVQVFKDLICDRLASLPAPIWNRYGVFLTLAKRVMEASYVHFIETMEPTVASI